MRRFLLICWLGLLALPCTFARAQATDDERARGHFLAAQSYFEQGRYAESAAQFDEAYRLSRRPRLLANASLAYERSGDLARAIERLEAFIAEGGTEADTQRTTLESRLATLRERLASTSPPDTPAPAEVTDPPPEPDETATHRDRGPLRALGFVAGGVGIGAGVVSLVTGLRGHAIHGELADVCGVSGDACPADRAGDIARGRRFARVSTATLGVAVAGIGTGIVLLLVGREDSGSAHVVPAVEAAAGRFVVSLSGSF